jgi:hypothetical protein
MKKLNVIWTALFLALCLCSLTYGTTILDTANTTSSWASVGYWGQYGSATMGQTFTVGSDNRLDNFTFWITPTLTQNCLTKWILAYT